MEIAYLAGLFDGEGCIRIAKVNNGETFGYSLQIAVQLLYQKNNIRNIPMFWWKC